MQRHYIFASHGNLAAGVLNSVEMILGYQDNLHVLCAYTCENEDLTQQVDILINQFSPQSELIVITDIFAGSVNTEFIRYLQRPHFHLISGLNLPLVIEMLINSQEKNTAQLITTSLANMRENIQYCNQTISHSETADNGF